MSVRRLLLCCGAATVAAALAFQATPGRAVVLPPGVTESVAFSGLEAPVVFRFAPDGRVFVGEKTGVIKVFSGLGDTTPTVFADLRTNVFNAWDRGLLGLALDPNFPATPAVYVLYTHDAAIGGTAPRWGTAGASWDDCPTPPGPNGDGCVVSGRLSRLTANGDVAAGPEQVLVEDWCQQYPSHTVGSIAFGTDGALYASAGDGASYGFADYGQDGTPLNPCGDPPGGVGGTQTPPTAEGGALRAQDVRTTGDPTGLDGTIIRVDPGTGAALPSNPFAFSGDANMRRIVAYGMRNPFRITMRPGTNELWIGDVGWGSWEEIDVTAAADTVADNFGWPCYEGNVRQDGYDAADLALCETLYATPGAVTAPYFTYSHSAPVVPGETCPVGSSSSAGIAFAPGAGVPDKYRNGLFFADYSRDCIWVMRTGGSGNPDPALVETFAAQASNPVDLQFGPDGALYYADVDGGAIRRLAFGSGGDLTPPVVGWSQPASGASLSGQVTVAATASDSSGVAGVQFLLDGQPLGSEDTTSPYSIVWDTAASANGQHTLAARARDTAGNTATSSTVTVTVTNQLQSLFANGGLEANMDGWGWNQGTATRATDHAHTGTASLKFVAAAATGAHGAYAGVPPNRIVGITAGTVYTATAYLTTDAAHPDVTPRIEWFDSSNTLLQTTSGQPATLPAGTWTKLTLSGTAPTGATRATVTYYAINDSGGATYYLDDFQLEGGSGTSTNTPPVPEIVTPGTSTPWRVDQTLAFSGRATDAEDGGLAASRLSWALVIQHCPSNCHSHTAQQWSGIASGSFVAPDHEYPSHLELRLTATDSGGASATTSIELFPETVDLTFASTPAGATITVGPTAETAPFTRTVIVGSANSVSAATSQSIGGTTYRFGSWSDGGAATHNITAPALPATLTATFVPNRAPTAAASATPTGGESPLAVSFDGSGSGDPDPGDVLTYAWDLDGDGAFDDATGVTAQRTYTAPGPVSVRLRATDQYGAEGISSPVVVTIADTQAPTVAITGPAGTVAGTQTVTATAGDGGSGIAGVRFLLDGVALGSEDTTAPYSTSWDTTQAANGQHSLTAVARDVAGNTTTSAPMSVDVQNGSTCPAGQWRAEYFANVTLTGSPAVVRCEQAIDNSWGGGGPTGAGVGTDNFSVRWSGRFSFVGTSTSFAATADDGIRVRLDGTLVIDQWRDQAATTFLSRRSVTPGLHDVSVEYYERAGSAVARVSWRDGLVAAYSFDEASGATVNDRSATGNPGTISGASRTSAGHTGRAVSFTANGNWVTVADSNTLDLTTALTLEAWVYPTILGSTTRFVLGKEAPSTPRYALYANTSSRPGARVDVAGPRTTIGAAQLPLNTWTHLAATFDGSTLRLFVNGVEVSSVAAVGSVIASTGALRIGGNSLAGEWFRGRVDDVRIYARALSVAEIKADAAAAVP